MAKQLEFKFELDRRFVKVMSHWLHDFSEEQPSTAGRIGAASFLVLVFVRSMVGSDSKSFPSQTYISKALGLSRNTVKRSIETLEEEKFVTKAKRGRHNTYALNEKMLMKSLVPEAYSDVVLSEPFGARGKKREQLEMHRSHFERFGKLPEGSPIKIEYHVHIGTQNNVTINDGGTAVFGELSDALKSIKDIGLRNRLAHAAMRDMSEGAQKLADELGGDMPKLQLVLPEEEDEG